MVSEAITSSRATQGEAQSEQAEAISRRAFLGAAVSAAAKGSAIVLGLPAILAACERAEQARRNGGGFRTLTDPEAAEFRAIAARIMPTDETPGAEEAGVIYFMDTILSDDPHQLTQLRDGLTDLQQRTQARHNSTITDSGNNNSSDTPASSTSTDDSSEALFHRLPPAQQDELLRDIEDSDFFRTLRFLTMAGMFCLPEYGGNQNLAGYRMLNYENRHVWHPPFGYYDAQQAAQ